MSLPESPRPPARPKTVNGMTPEQRIELGCELFDVQASFLMARYSRQYECVEDWLAAFRRWYAEQMEEKDRMWRQFAERLNRSQGGARTDPSDASERYREVKQD